MSDTFDHLCDAFESLILGDDYDGLDCNPLFYHRKFHGAKIAHKTEKAYLIKYLDGEFWVPKKLCKFKDKAIYIWENFEPEFIIDEVSPMRGEELYLTPVHKPVKEYNSKDKTEKGIIDNIKPLVTSTPQGTDPLYEEWKKSNSKDTFAKWCSDRLPF